MLLLGVNALNRHPIAIDPAENLPVAPWLGRIHSIQHDLAALLVACDGGRGIVAVRRRKFVLLDPKTRVGPDVQLSAHTLLQARRPRAVITDDDIGHGWGCAHYHGVRSILGPEARYLAFDLECDGDRPSHATDPTAVRAGLGEDTHEALAAPLARHLDETQRTQMQDLRLLSVTLQGVLEGLLQPLPVARAVHIYEVDHDDPPDVPEA
jgi:hypothetical protein